ncbi:MAG: DUF4339 domain-containing protein [Planctomycetaceae bacterium]|jgi:hypothetical protein|nr:DUF4339 domain-containing protein [Planctomycetaceae bacterium]
MSSQWFTKKPNEEKRGPFSDNELKQLTRTGKLLATDFVWREGMSQAVPASKIKGLFQKTPPVIPPPVTLPPPTSPPLPPPLVDPNNLDALIAGLVPTQQNVTGYVPNSTAQNRNEKENQQEESDDVFSWYRSGDSRAPILVNSITFWQAIHAVGSKNKAFYFLLPIIVVIPLGFLLGIINSLIPFFFINWIILFVVSAGVGEAVFQCFRLAGVHNKFFSMGYGFLCGLLTCYFFLAGGLFCDYNRNTDKDDPPLSVIRAAMLDSIIWYVKMKSETMSITKHVLHGKPLPPNRFLNYAFIFVDLLIIVLMMSAASGGGRQNVSGGTTENSNE